MKRHWTWIIGIAVCLLAAGSAYFLAMGMMESIYAYRSSLHENPPQPGEAVGEPLSQRVVFVLIDALRLDTASDASIMPFLNQIRQQGAWANMYSREPTYSATAYSVIFTGAWPELSDGPVFNLETADIPVWTQDNLFSAAMRGGLQSAVSGYEWFEKLIPQGAVVAGYYTPGEDRYADRAVVDAALPWLESVEYELVLIHLDQVDYAGHHEGGPQDPNWAAAAGRVDELLAEIAAQLDFSRDTLFVCSDHGQVDSGGHGGEEQAVQREPFVLVGAGVLPGEYDAVQMVDIAPTLAALLGLNLPASTQGQVRIEILALSGENLAAVEAAQVTQQTLLAEVYGESINRTVEIVENGDIVESTYQAMQDARKELVDADRLPRLLIAGVLALIPVAWLGWRWKRDTGWLLAGTVGYHLVFNLWYALIEGKGYTFSYVIGPTELVVAGLVTALIAFSAGWLLAALGAGAFSWRARKAAEFSLGLALVILFTLSLPVLWSYAWDGFYVSEFLPDFSRSYLALLALVQGLAVGLWGLSFAGVAVLVTSIKGRRR
jgi:hypothetical protein